MKEKSKARKHFLQLACETLLNKSGIKQEPFQRYDFHCFKKCMELEADLLENKLCWDEYIFSQPKIACKGAYFSE